MSEEQITMLKKEKDPIRVKAGKRLSEYNKTAKGKKIIEQASTDNTDTEYDEYVDSKSSGISIMAILTGVGVISGVVCLYFTYKQDKRAELQTNDSDSKVNVNKIKTENNYVPQEPNKKIRSFNN